MKLTFQENSLQNYDWFDCIVRFNYASVNWDSTGSDNGVSPIRRQAII